MISFPNAQKGVSPPTRRRGGKNAMMVKFINYKWMLVLYSIGTMFLVIIHISHTQKWAAPFPCSKTKSKISFSLGWAQEGLSQNRPATTHLRMDTIENLSAWIIFMCGIFGFYIVWAQRCL